MGKSACPLFFLVCWIVFLPAIAFALQVPPRADGYVTDRAGLLSPFEKANLEAILRAFEEKTSNQVVVVTFPSLEGESLEDFSMQLAETWQAGQKKRDNGVIFLIFKNDRKMRIEVGYGLEGVLTDATSGQIINQVVAPYFKKGDYQGGIFAGVDAIMKATQGEFKGSGSREDYDFFWAHVFYLLLMLGILHFLFAFFSVLAGRRKGHHGFWIDNGGIWDGGGFGGGSGGGSGGGGFSGGGGGFGGGGASGGW